MTIAEVGKKYNLTPDTLRYYERIGLISGVPRNHNGIRNYDNRTCDRIEFIKCMRNAGVEIEILIEYINLFENMFFLKTRFNFFLKLFKYLKTFKSSILSYLKKEKVQ